MARHIWGGPEMRSPEGENIYWKPNDEAPCPPKSAKKKVGIFAWFQRNKGPALTLANIGLVLIVGLVFWPLISKEAVEPVHGDWMLSARFYTDGETAILSMEFTSATPQPDGFVVRLAEEERTLQSISVQLDGISPQIVRKKLSFLPSGESLDLWIDNQRVHARKE